MQIIKYQDCCAFNFIGGKAAENAEECSIEFPLINGRSTDIILKVRKKKNGMYKVLEVLFPKDLPEKDINDLAGVYWYVFPKNMRNKKVQPIIMYWEFGDRLIIASKRGDKQETIKEYEEKIKNSAAG